MSAEQYGQITSAKVITNIIGGTKSWNFIEFVLQCSAVCTCLHCAYDATWIMTIDQMMVGTDRQN